MEGDRGFYDTVELITRPGFVRSRAESRASTNTTIGVVATNASVTTAQANRLALVAQDGLALALRPCHTMGDGDVVFALATGTHGSIADRALVTRLGAAATRVMARAIVRAITEATGLGGVPSARELGLV